MSARQARWLPGFVLAAALGASVLQAQEPVPPPAKAWTGTAYGYWYVLPDDENYLLPIVTARHGRLHLETRYNYEDRDTASFFGGWVFETGTKVEFGATPMLGAVVGQTDGIAPGCTLTFAWKKLSVYSENEYVVDLSDSSLNFFYNWGEITYDPADWVSVGVATQRTRVYETDRDLQRGLMARFTMGRYSASAYWFNPGSSDDFGVVSFGAEF